MRNSATTNQIEQLDWVQIETDLNQRGWAVVPGLLTPDACHNLSALYQGNDQLFRSRVVMRRHGFGQGEYKYFSYPLPDIIQSLRAAIYPKLAPIANHWAERLGQDIHYPADHEAYLRLCHEAGQTRPTPLILQYEAGDYNCLHQDLYGDLVFPLQMAVLLSRPEEDFDGGAFIITEQRPRMQSRPHLVPLAQGDAVIFAVNERPVKGARGYYRVRLRHGVSEVWRGRRHTLGLIFHDAR